ncbi:MAG: SNF1-interacting protein [Watsoniomyces obsoletus]|nr:MAG: SNF1-interacting protein [Watsoniomyces obsoletus]
MGNSSGKEQRPPAGLSPSSNSGAADHGRHPHPHSRSVSENSAFTTPTLSPTSTHESSRRGRNGRPDLSVLGITQNSDRDIASLESRRETKQEREARRLERERAARVKERERSMKEESVDGGYLVTQGVYTGTEDFNKAIVRRLMIERRLAPFFKGINDHSSGWRDDQLVAAVRGQPIPVDAPLPPDPPPGPPEPTTLSPPGQDQMLKSLTIDISSRSPSFTSDSSANLSPTRSTAPVLMSGPTPLTTSSSPFRPRSKTLASLTSLARNYSQEELTPQEIRLPSSSSLDGRPIEAVLYKDASECPICFLYYPPYLNRTRCCDQAICSECFVQIKRPDPHPPEHAEGAAPTSSRAETGRSDDSAEEPLVSEPAACPYCVQPEFGVTYDPPPFRTGLAYGNQRSVHGLAHPTSAMSSSSSLASGPGAGSRGATLGRRRTGSISATSSAVITTDRIRPDWSQKLADARAHVARRSAAATALHTAVYLISGEGRSFSGFGRRNRLGRNARSDANGTNPTPSGLRRRESDGPESSQAASDREESSGSHTIRIGGPAGSSGEGGSGRSGRRSRLEDLEEMMMMEAIRLSLASEEERKRKEEEQAEKEEKALETQGMFNDDDDTNRSRPQVQFDGNRVEQQPGQDKGSSSTTTTTSKGKAIDRGRRPKMNLPPPIHDNASSSLNSISHMHNPISSGVSKDGVARPPSPARGASNNNTDGSKFAFGSLDAMVGSEGEPSDDGGGGGGGVSSRREKQRQASDEIRGH